MPVNNALLVRAVCCLILSALAACGPRMAARTGEPDPAATVQPVYVATQRDLDDTGAHFGGQRNAHLNHFRADISIPPTHRTGRVEWPDATPDAATDFVVVNTQVFDDGAELIRDLRGGRDTVETMVFVHGYNNTLSETMYRFAQIRQDFDKPGPGLLFSWQSAGDPRGYIYDRDSVLFARDALVSTLKGLTRHRGDRVFLVAHSMGAQLTMEALRQMAIGGDRHLLDAVAGVVLVSPDIDPDLFRSQVRRIGDLREPITVVVSRRDRVLGLASLLFGSKKRLGVIDSPRQVAGLDVRVVDVTALSDRHHSTHFIPATSAAAVKAIRGLAEGRGDRLSLPLQYTILGAPGARR